MKSPWLWIILGLALAVRLSLLAAAWNHPDRMMTNDSNDYMMLAQTLRSEHAFHTSFMDHAPVPNAIWMGGCADPQTFRTPGYPVFLMPLASIDREDLELLHDEPRDEWGLQGLGTVTLLQVLLDVLLVFLTYHLGRILVSHRVGLFAAAFQALSPVVIASCCRILSDSLYALLLTLAIVLFVRHFRKGRGECNSASRDPASPESCAVASRQEADGESIVADNVHNEQGCFEWWSLALAAVIMVAACYVRPVGLVMMLLAIFILMFSRMKFRRLALFIMIMAMGIAPWVVRNSIVADYKGFSTFAIDSMYMYSVRETKWYVEEHPDSWTAYKLGEDETYYPVQIWPNNRQERERVVFWVLKSYPIAFAIVHLKGDVAFWLPGAPDVLEVAGMTTGGKNTLEVLQTQGLAAAVKNYFGDNTTALLLALPMVAILLVKYAGVLASLKRARLHMRPEVWLMVLIVIVSALLPGPAAHPRFRVPVEPILNIPAAVGWMLIVGWIAGRRKSKTA